MSDQTDNYLKLKPFGLSDDEAKLYLLLVEKGFTTALTLSRLLKLARTKVYRLLDKLVEKQLVEQKITDRGMQFGATDPERLNQLFGEKQQEVETMKRTLPDLLSTISQLSQSHTSPSKVLYYKGIEGLKQVNYNLTRAKDLLRVYEVEHMSDYLPKDFSEDIRQKFVDKGIVTHDLTNKKSFPDFTTVTKMITDYSEFRYISPKLLKIDFEAIIYNDVYATYTYKGNEIFCVEIYNATLANMQKQIYDFIWKQATPLKFKTPNGAAAL